MDMAHFKLNEADENFLNLPQGATLIFAGTSGTETWIERERDTIVRISVKSVATAMSDGGVLEACIEIGDASAKGLDGPSPIEAQLRINQSVQVLVKAGQRLAFKAYPTARDAQLLRTIVCTSDLEHEHGPDAPSRSSPNIASLEPQATRQSVTR
jgi:hypothetical protein